MHFSLRFGNLKSLAKARERERVTQWQQLQEWTFSSPSPKVCGKMFNRKGYLKKHTLIHTGEKPFMCTVCSKGFAQSGHLNTHMRTHTGEKPFACKVCGKEFGQLRYLKTHMRNHTGEKPFSCTVCCKAFSHRCSLKDHMRTHTGEKPFSCSDLRHKTRPNLTETPAKRVKHLQNGSLQDLGRGC